MGFLLFYSVRGDRQAGLTADRGYWLILDSRFWILVYRINGKQLLFVLRRKAEREEARPVLLAEIFYLL